MTNPVSVGTISSSSVGSDVVLKDNILITNTQAYYYVYIWLDGYLTDATYIELPFSGHVKAEAVQNNDIEAVSLPSGYERIYYIKSTRTQYLNTGYYPNTATQMKLTLSFDGSFTPVNTEGGSAIIFNAQTQQYQANFGGNSNQSGTIFFWINANVVPGSSETLAVDATTLRNKNVFILNPDSVTYGTFSRTLTPKVTNSTGSLYIFGKNASNIFTAYDMLVYDLKLLEDGNLIKHFVACKRTSDGVAGLCEVNGGTFHSSLTSDEFVAGPNI